MIKLDEIDKKIIENATILSDCEARIKVADVMDKDAVIDLIEELTMKIEMLNDELKDTEYRFNEYQELKAAKIWM